MNIPTIAIVCVASHYGLGTPTGWSETVCLRRVDIQLHRRLLNTPGNKSETDPLTTKMVGFSSDPKGYPVIVEWFAIWRGISVRAIGVRKRQGAYLHYGRGGFCLTGSNLAAKFLKLRGGLASNSLDVRFLLMESERRRRVTPRKAEALASRNPSNRGSKAVCDLVRLTINAQSVEHAKAIIAALGSLPHWREHCIYAFTNRYMPMKQRREMLRFRASEGVADTCRRQWFALKRLARQT